MDVYQVINWFYFKKRIRLYSRVNQHWNLPLVHVVGRGGIFVALWLLKYEIIFPKQVWGLTSLLLFLTASSCVWSSSISARKQEVVTKTHYKKKTAQKYSRPLLLTTAERSSSTCRLHKSWLPYILSLINSCLWFSQHSPSSVTASVAPLETFRQRQFSIIVANWKFSPFKILFV